MSAHATLFKQASDVWRPLMSSLDSLPMRRTLRHTSVFEGIGVHSGENVRMTLKAASAGSGIVFQYEGVSMLACYKTVRITPMATTLVHPSGLTIHTIEHVMAALYGCGVTDALILLEGCPEVPIMDGSAAPFLKACNGAVGLGEPSSAITILQPIEVSKGSALARFSPSMSRRFSFTYEKSSPFYAYTQGQTATFDWSEDGDRFDSLVAPARTFGFFEDGQRLQAMGLARGASLNNTVVLRDHAVMNADGLRMPNEMLQHKLLDAMGDIALWGGLIYGHFEGVNTGHALNNALLHALADNPDAWQVVRS